MVGQSWTIIVDMREFSIDKIIIINDAVSVWEVLQSIVFRNPFAKCK